MKFFTVTLFVLPILTSALPHTSIELDREKRAGSFDFIGGITNGLVSGVASASAAVASGSSGASGKSFPAETTHVHIHHEEPKFDGWQIKKSILNTIFQAVKAITGGVTAIKGKLIKGSGGLVSASGSLIAASGDSVSNKGKDIALSAKLIHPGPSHFAKLSGASSSSSLGSGHLSTAHGGESFTSYEAPHAPAVEYGPPPSILYKPVSTSLSYIAPTIHSGQSLQHGAPFELPHHNEGYHYPPPPHGHGFDHPPSPHSHDFRSSSSIETIPDKPLPAKFASATAVLRNVLSKIKTPVFDHDIPSHNEIGNSGYGGDIGEISFEPPQQNIHDGKFEQHSIPPDVPHFKPINSGGLSGSYPSAPSGFNSHQSLPYETFSQTQSFSSEHGVPLSQNYHNSGPGPVGLSPGGWSNGPSNNHQIPNSYNAYHTMTLRRTNQNNNRAQTHSKRNAVNPKPPVTKQIINQQNYKKNNKIQKPNPQRIIPYHSHRHQSITKPANEQQRNLKPNNVQQTNVLNRNVPQTKIHQNTVKHQSSNQEINKNPPSAKVKPVREDLKSSEHLNDDQMHKHQINQIQQTFGSDVEIQKSISYEIKLDSKN